jgi:hypothetical protein
MKYCFSLIIFSIFLYFSKINANSNYNNQILYTNRKLKESVPNVSELYDSNDPLSIDKYCNRPWPELELFLPVRLDILIFNSNSN